MMTTTEQINVFKQANRLIPHDLVLGSSCERSAMATVEWAGIVYDRAVKVLKDSDQPTLSFPFLDVLESDSLVNQALAVIPSHVFEDEKCVGLARSFFIQNQARSHGFRSADAWHISTWIKAAPQKKPSLFLRVLRFVRVRT